MPGYCVGSVRATWTPASQHVETPLAVGRHNSLLSDARRQPRLLINELATWDAGKIDTKGLSWALVGLGAGDRLCCGVPQQQGPLKAQH